MRKLICFIVGHDWIIPQSPYMFRPIECARCGRHMLNDEGLRGYGGFPRLRDKH